VLLSKKKSLNVDLNSTSLEILFFFTGMCILFQSGSHE
jgi:hypothetical protein